MIKNAVQWILFSGRNYCNLAKKSWKWINMQPFWFLIYFFAGHLLAQPPTQAPKILAENEGQTSMQESKEPPGQLFFLPLLPLLPLLGILKLTSLFMKNPLIFFLNQRILPVVGIASRSSLLNRSLLRLKRSGFWSLLLQRSCFRSWSLKRLCLRPLLAKVVVPATSGSVTVAVTPIPPRSAVGLPVVAVTAPVTAGSCRLLSRS